MRSSTQAQQRGKEKVGNEIIDNPDVRNDKGDDNGDDHDGRDRDTDDDVKMSGSRYESKQFCGYKRYSVNPISHKIPKPRKMAPGENFGRFLKSFEHYANFSKNPNKLRIDMLISFLDPILIERVLALGLTQ